MTTKRPFSQIGSVSHSPCFRSGDDVTIDPVVHFGTRQFWYEHLKADIYLVEYNFLVLVKYFLDILIRRQFNI